MEYLHFTWIFEVCLYEKQNTYNSELHANLCFIFFSMQYKPEEILALLKTKKGCVASIIIYHYHFHFRKNNLFLTNHFNVNSD